MEWNTTTLGMMTGLFFIGYLIGLYEGRWKHGKKLKALENARDQARDETRQVREKLAELQARLEELRAAPSPTLSLEESASGMQVQLDGQVLQPDTLSDHQHRRLLAVLTQLTPYIKRKKIAAPPPRPSAATAAPAPVMAGAQAEQPPASGSLSIVQQIDRILQEKIRGTELARLGLRLEDAPDGSVIVWIGLKRYQGVGAVPDPTVKAVIQNAIAEWEQKH